MADNESDVNTFVYHMPTGRKFSNQLDVQGANTSKKVAKIKTGKAQAEPQFIERTHFLTDKIFEYERLGSDPGIVLIFNQETFSSLSPRRGSRKDVNEIIICLQRLGFNIHEHNICNDFKRQEIMDKLDEVANDDRYLLNTNCLILIFLTHGDDFEVLYVSDGTIKTNEIWNKFSRCKGLENKPKMFIFQACKGENYSTTNGETNEVFDNPPSSIVNMHSFSAKQMGPDMLAVYSTVEGNISFRHPVNGSWFIQELCKNFSAYGRRDDVISLIIRTTKCVCGNYYNDNETLGVVQKQMPLFVSTLRRKFYLNRNKDRDILLKIQQGNEEIIKLIKDVKEKVDKLCLEDEHKNKYKK